jgi:ribosomal protein S18 acetylase RimI-like enzyme
MLIREKKRNRLVRLREFSTKMSEKSKTDVRPVKREEIKSIQELYRDVNVELGTSKLFLDSVISSHLDSYDKLVNSRGSCLVALVDNKIVGMVVYRESACACQSGHKVLELERLAVLSAHRLRGVGGALTRAVLAVAHESQLAVHLTAMQDNTSAIAFYAKLGFKTTETEHRVSPRTGAKYVLLHLISK